MKIHLRLAPDSSVGVGYNVVFTSIQAAATDHRRFRKKRHAAQVSHCQTTINVTETPPVSLFTCQDDNNGNNQFWMATLEDVLPGICFSRTCGSLTRPPVEEVA